MLAQLATAILAFRLNVQYGRRPAWTLIAAALLTMACRRILTLCILLQGNSQPGGIWELPEMAALATCVSSLLLLGGISMISPVYRSIQATESVLRIHNQELKGDAAANAAELDLARQIQEKLLPSESPSIDGYDIAAVSMPAETVGGDSFDFRELANGELLISVTDVSGHGVGPALQMAQLQTVFRALATTMNEPAEMLELANRLFHETSPAGRFATAFLGALVPSTGEFHFAAAGHEAWLLRRDSDENVSLGGRSSGLILGVMQDVSYSGTVEFLRPGDALLLTTDGCTEMHSPQGELFGTRRMLEAVRKDLNSGAKTGIQSLIDSLTVWRADREPIDDLTALLVIRRSGSAH